MPHQPKPFFKANRGVWYVEINRKQYNLGKHPEGLPPPVKKNGIWQAPPAIMTSFYKVMAQDRVEVNPVREVTGQLVLAIIDEFLDWCQKHKAPLTYEWYRLRTQGFAATVPRHLLIAELKPIHVEKWVDAHPEWSSTHQRGCKIAVQRVFRWAEKMGVIDRNPIRYLEKPQAGKREQIIASAEYAMIREHFPDEAFRELLEMAWHTGARPQEVVRIEARHVDLANRRIVLPPKEAKGKKRFRIIYLNDTALALVCRKIGEHPVGAIFRNLRAPPWTAWAVNNRFCRLQQAQGRDNAQPLKDAEVQELAARLRPTKMVKGQEITKTELERLREARKKLRAKESAKNGVKYALYAFRHTFANRLLAAEVDSLTVSTLLGHVDGTMLSRVYQHLQQNADHLLAAVNTAAIKAEDASI